MSHWSSRTCSAEPKKRNFCYFCLAGNSSSYFPVNRLSTSRMWWSETNQRHLRESCSTTKKLISFSGVISSGEMCPIWIWMNKWDDCNSSQTALLTACRKCIVTHISWRTHGILIISSLIIWESLNFIPVCGCCRVWIGVYDSREGHQDLFIRYNIWIKMFEFHIQSGFLHFYLKTYWQYIDACQVIPSSVHSVCRLIRNDWLTAFLRVVVCSVVFSDCLFLPSLSYANLQSISFTVFDLKRFFKNPQRPTEIYAWINSPFDFWMFLWFSSFHRQTKKTES